MTNILNVIVRGDEIAFVSGENYCFECHAEKAPIHTDLD